MTLTTLTGIESLLPLLSLFIVIGLMILGVALANLWKVSATKSEVDAIEDRIDSKIEEERRTAREALGRVHSRIDDLANEAGKVRGSLDEIAQNVRMLVQKQIKE